MYTKAFHRHWVVVGSISQLHARNIIERHLWQCHQQLRTRVPRTLFSLTTVNLPDNFISVIPTIPTAHDLTDLLVPQILISRRSPTCILPFRTGDVDISVQIRFESVNHQRPGAQNSFSLVYASSISLMPQFSSTASRLPYCIQRKHSPVPSLGLNQHFGARPCVCGGV
jgi:hypothetical protein